MSRARQNTLFDGIRIGFDDAIQLTIDSVKAYGARHSVWCIAWSGGKDSTALLTLIIWLIETGQLDPPKRLIVCYADTRMELPPLSTAAYMIIDLLRQRGVEVRIVMAEMDKRFFVYMLGRGVPPPNNNTFRWCTRQIKVDPMATEIGRIVEASESGVLMLTGVRQGESAVRDGRIAMSCGRDGAECGQGWYQQMSGDGFATLAPILHWRVCLIWDWLVMAGGNKHGGWPTSILAEAYGGDEATEINARTGCVGCPLANQDTALDVVLHHRDWKHLAPLKELRPLYRELREPCNRLRQPQPERLKNGSVGKNPYRMGPLTLEARRYALDRILDIQSRCNVPGRPVVDILNGDETARIEELIAANTWPRKWSGDEPLASEPYEEILNGVRQARLWGIGT